MKALKSRDEFLDNFNTNFDKHFPVAGIEPRISDNSSVVNSSMHLGSVQPKP